MSTHNRQPELEAAIHLALDALNFDAGNWHQENIERHLREQIALARKHLQAVISLDQQERASGLNQVKAAAVMYFADLFPGSFESGFIDTPATTIGDVYQVARHHVRDTYGMETKSLADAMGEEFARECCSTADHDAEVVEQFARELGVFDSQYDDQEYIEVPRHTIKEYADQLRQHTKKEPEQ